MCQSCSEQNIVMTAEDILKLHGVKKTAYRKCVIDKLIESEDTALPENEIENTSRKFLYL